MVLIWQLISLWSRLPRFVLPTPGDVAATTVSQWPYLWANTIITVTEVLLGFGLSVLLGVAIGIAAAKSRGFAESVYPLLVSSQSVPKLALAPLFLIWFGFGELPKVVIAFLVAFYPIAINSAVGLSTVSQDAVMLAYAIGLRGIRRFQRIDLPAALPSMFAGFKIAITFSVIGAVVGEFVGGQAGLGYLTINASTTFDTSLLFSSMLLLGALGILGYGIISFLERLCIPWRRVGIEERLARFGTL